MIDGDNYLMNNAFTNCVQLGHLVCYENFKNQFIKNKHLNCPKLKVSDYDLYAMTVDKYKFIESLIDKNFENIPVNKTGGVLDIKRISYLYNEENEKLSINEIEGLYGTSKKFVILFNKDSTSILNKLANYIKKSYVESLNEVLDELQFGEDIIEEMKISFAEINEIFDLNKLAIMKMFINCKNPILDYVGENNNKNHLATYNNEDKFEIDNGIENEYDNFISLYEKKYKKQIVLNKIENITMKPIAELKELFSDLDWHLFDEDNKESFNEYDVNRIVLYILNYYKVLDEFEYYGVEMAEYFWYLSRFIQNNKIIRWEKEYYEGAFYKENFKMAEYFDYLQNYVEDLAELNKLKDHLHLYSNIRNSIISKYESEEKLKDILSISNSYEKIIGSRVIYEYKSNEFYNDGITENLIVLLIEIEGWESNLLNEIFNEIINKNLLLFEKTSDSYRQKCFCDENGIILYNKYINNNTSLDEYAKELNFSYDLYSQLKNLGVKTFYEMLVFNWQMLVDQSSLLNERNYNELINTLLQYGIDIKFKNNENNILLLGLPILIRMNLEFHKISEILQLVNIDYNKLADILHNRSDDIKLLINRLHRFGIDLNKNTFFTTGVQYN